MKRGSAEQCSASITVPVQFSSFLDNEILQEPLLSRPLLCLVLARHPETNRLATDDMARERTRQEIVKTNKQSIVLLSIFGHLFSLHATPAPPRVHLFSR